MTVLCFTEYMNSENVLCMMCSKTCLATVLIRSIFARKICTSASARVQFFQRKIERINTVARHVLLKSRICFLHKQQNREKYWLITNSKHKVWTGNPTGNSRCHVLASRACRVTVTNQRARQKAGAWLCSEHASSIHLCRPSWAIIHRVYATRCRTLQIKASHKGKVWVESYIHIPIGTIYIVW